MQSSFLVDRSHDWIEIRVLNPYSFGVVGHMILEFYNNQFRKFVYLLTFDSQTTKPRKLKFYTQNAEKNYVPNGDR